MDIRFRDTGEIIDDNEFKKRHPNTSFANGVVPVSFVNDKGADVILEGAQPIADWWQYVFRDGVEKIKKNWHWKYSLGPVFDTPEELAAYKAEREAERKRHMETLVNEERKRRLDEGLTVGSVFIPGYEAFLPNLALTASLKLTDGDASTVMVYRDGNNVQHALVPSQIIDLWKAFSAHTTNLHEKSWALKNLDVIPLDFQDDKYWT